MPAPVQEPSRPDADRYEPLPGITGLPRWVWVRLPRAGKIAVALLPLAAIGLALLLGPGIDRSKDEREQAQAARLAKQRADRAARLRIEQRPRFGRGVAAGSDVGQRTELLADARAAIEQDALDRVAAGSLEGPVRRVTCEPFPRSLDDEGAHLDPGRSSGRYACLAVTQDVPAGERSVAAAIGHPYRLRIDFSRGRYALCKVAGRPGEGAPVVRPPVTVPRACGGGP
jgi:hypothetical protein